jgi:uncharacterized protein YvpB
MNNLFLTKIQIKTFFFIAILTISWFSLAPLSQAALLDVPYTSQVPFGQWSDPRQRDGCEEASILMAMAWVRGGQISPEEARLQIDGMSDFEQYFFGYFEDSSAQDTANLIVQYFGYSKIDVQHNISTTSIKSALDFGYLVIVPINPRVISTVLYNNFTTRHMVVVVGYDNSTNEIIFHDPLTGPNRRVAEATFGRALADYPSGRHIISNNRPSAMIIVAK